MRVYVCIDPFRFCVKNCIVGLKIVLFWFFLNKNCGLFLENKKMNLYFFFFFFYKKEEKEKEEEGEN